MSSGEPLPNPAEASARILARLRTLPGWEPEAGAQIGIDGVHAFGRSWSVASTPDALTVEVA